MRINLGSQLETFKVIFTITYGNQTSVQEITAPRMLLESNFLSLMEQASQTSAPMYIKMERHEYIWDNFEQKQKQVPNFIEFKNNAFIRMEEQQNGTV